MILAHLSEPISIGCRGGFESQPKQLLSPLIPIATLSLADPPCDNQRLVSGYQWLPVAVLLGSSVDLTGPSVDHLHIVSSVHLSSVKDPQMLHQLWTSRQP